MKKKDIEQKTFAYFHSGFNCAESIMKAFVELYSKNRNRSMTKFASGFGGGIGGSHCETCGALTGGIIAISWLFGRTDPSDDKQKVLSLSAEFRSLFLKRYNSTNCKEILDLMGNQEIKQDCKELTAEYRRHIERDSSERKCKPSMNTQREEERKWGGDGHAQGDVCYRRNGIELCECGDELVEIKKGRNCRLIRSFVSHSNKGISFSYEPAVLM